MVEFYGPRGEPNFFASQKVKPPLVGELVAPYAGDAALNRMPGLPSKLNVQFDTSKLEIQDYRIMREHPQITASLAVLSFMMYQRDYRVRDSSSKILKHVEANLDMIYKPLIRALSKAFWAGYSPIALQWKNDLPGGKVWIDKIKDLRPEDCVVRWKKVKGVGERKGTPYGRAIKQSVQIYDGIKQFGYGGDIPVENSLWYPLLMEDGNYYGKKMLNSVFQPWYFHLLMNLYANRYYERFAEPTPLGRAPFDEKIRIGNKDVPGNQMLRATMEHMRSGGSAVLPNTRTPDGFNGDSTYDYTLEFLESQLRGVDYERRLAALNDEISVGLLVPTLLMRSGDTGSSNLGVVQHGTYLNTINAVGGDWEEYINKYIVRPMVIHNFGKNAKVPKFEYRKLGRMDAETMRMLLQALVGGGKARVTDLSELGAMAGLDLTEVKEVTQDPDDQTPLNPDGTKKDPRVGRPGRPKEPTGDDKVRKVGAKIAARMKEQALAAHRNGTWGNEYEPDLGFRRQVIEALAPLPEWDADQVYRNMQDMVGEVAEKGTSFDPDMFSLVTNDVCRSIMLTALEDKVVSDEDPEDS